MNEKTDSELPADVPSDESDAASAAVDRYWKALSTGDMQSLAAEHQSLPAAIPWAA